MSRGSGAECHVRNKLCTSLAGDKRLTSTTHFLELREGVVFHFPCGWLSEQISARVTTGRHGRHEMLAMSFAIGCANPCSGTVSKYEPHGCHQARTTIPQYTSTGSHVFVQRRSTTTQSSSHPFWRCLPASPRNQLGWLGWYTL